MPQQTGGSVAFARWRQSELRIAHIGASWRIRLNLCFLRHTRVHNQNGKSIGSAALLHSSRQKVPIFYNGRCFPQRLPPPVGAMDPHLIHGCLVAPESSTQTTSRSVQPFLHSSQQRVPVLYDRPYFPLKIAHSHGI